jgi:hypothetical protein
MNSKCINLILLLLARFLAPPELRRAMKSLGFKVSREEAKQLATDGSLKGVG